jgi:xylulokinase
MEGVALEVLACVRLLSGLGIHLREVASMGGGSKSVVWNQIKSDVLGMKVEVPKNLDGASIGALSLAMVANGQVSLGDLPGLVSRLNPTESTYMPRDEMTRLYSKMFATYNELYSRVAPLFGDLGSPD